LQARKQAEADAFNAKNFPTWTTHWHRKPKLPLRHRPSSLHCPVCNCRFAIKKRGPIPQTCSRRCGLALALHHAYQRGRNEPLTLLQKDIKANEFLVERKRRHQRIIDDLLDDLPTEPV